MMRRFVGGIGGGGRAWPVCVTVTVRPATVSVPLRADVVAGTRKLTDPIPDPVPPAVIVIQLSIVVAVHGQLAPVTTDSVSRLPLDGTVNVVGVTE
jgi:hypothetical protein